MENFALNAADEDQKQSAYSAAVEGWSQVSFRNQRWLRSGVVGGRSARGCGLGVVTPGAVLGAQPAGCRCRGLVAGSFVQRPMSGGSMVGGLGGCSRCRDLTTCSSRPRNCCFVSTEPCRRGGLTQR
jgi:hypothetical protein